MLSKAALMPFTTAFASVPAIGDCASNTLARSTLPVRSETSFTESETCAACSPAADIGLERADVRHDLVVDHQPFAGL